MYVLLLIGSQQFRTAWDEMTRRSGAMLWAQRSRYPPAVSAKQASTARPTLIQQHVSLEPIHVLVPMTHRPSFSLTTSSITSLSRFGNIPYSVLQMC